MKGESAVQHESGMMVYPARGWRRALFRLPLLFWRLGLARLMPRNFLLLTTTGRRSGLSRRTMVEYSALDGTIYIASGWGERADWYRNALANPVVTMESVREGQVQGRVLRVTEPAELATLYHRMSGESPYWGPYLRSLGIEESEAGFVGAAERLHILRLEPTRESAPEPLGADLAWIWPVVAAAAIFLRSLRGRFGS